MTKVSSNRPRMMTRCERARFGIQNESLCVSLVEIGQVFDHFPYFST